MDEKNINKKKVKSFSGFSLGILVFGVILLSPSFASAINISTASYSVNSIHLGTSGTGNISTSNYSARDTITYQQASTSNLQTTSYTANSGWFFVESTSVGEVNITEIFFSNETVFNFSNVFNQSEITYNMTLEYIGANCTAIIGSVANVTFSLLNVEDNTTYINTTGYTYRLNDSGNITDLYILNASYTIRDSGNWTLNVSCFASSGGSADKDASLWEILWGNLTINLVQPLVDTSVQIYEFFTFSANVSCSGGECGIVNVTLDPHEIGHEINGSEIDGNCQEVTTCINVTIGTECVSETVQSCGQECSLELVQVCVGETNEVCEDVCIEYEDINGTQGNCLVYEFQCNNVTQEVCNEIEQEICVDVNCTESIVETCNDIIEQNCTTEVVCDTSSEIPVEIPSNETSGNETLPKLPESVNESDGVGEGGESGNGTEIGNETQTPPGEGLGNETEQIEFPETNETIETIVDSFEMKLNISDKEARIIFDKNVSIINQAIIVFNVSNENIFAINNLENETEFEYLTPILALELDNESSATVYLPKLENKNINVIRKCDDWNFGNNSGCNVDWYVYTLVDESMQNDSFVWFDVDSFSAYAGGNLTTGETSFLTIWDYNDVGMPNASVNTTNIKIANETIQFFADYEIARNGTKITNGNCTIDFSDINTTNMTYNSTYTYFVYERNFTTNGAYPYTVSCTSSTYTNLDVSDSIVIGPFTNETKGAISTTVGDVPFYTISANPSQIISLRGGENQTITWSVNATGILNKIYDFFVEAFGYVSFNYTANVSNNGSDYYPINISGLVNSTHLNLQITANDTTAPVFVSTTATPSAVINGSGTIINADVSDNVQVDGVWANVTLPDNSSEFVSPGNLPYNFTNTSQIGIYTVVFYANDTSGNNATTTKTFQVALPVNLTINIEVSVDISANISSSITANVLVAGTNEVLSTIDINGSAALLLPNVPVDISFETSFDNDTSLTLLFNFNLTESVGGSINFGNIRVDPFLLTYGVDTNFSFTSAQVIVSYQNVSVADENNLQFHKCNNYSVDTGTCISGFNDITSDAGTTQDQTNNKFTYNTTSFSGFGIKEVTPSTTTTTTTTVGGGGGVVAVHQDMS